MTEIASQVAQLKTLIGKLQPKDQEFATSLCDQFERRGNLSPKQTPWVEKLIAKTVPRQTQQIGSMKGAIELFDRARQNLKQPKVVLALGQDIVRLSVAGQKARFPGTVNVTDGGRFGENVWFGRIFTDGRFEQSNRNEVLPDGLIDLLTRFAADPAGVAAEYGRLTGVCCFCDRPLKDAKSTAVGYGPVCAKRFGLPWGVKSQAEEVALPQAA